ncbi:MAG: DUF1858 domain-containing protein [Ignavibacteriae bacterium]|nr:DUF1858 domain-containing protein [Ignavibacteriota bacterium]
MKKIIRTISIEELLENHPGSVQFLIKRNLPCLVCGEPSWGTLEELACEKEYGEQEIDMLVRDMNAQLVEGEEA